MTDPADLLRADALRYNWPRLAAWLARVIGWLPQAGMLPRALWRAILRELQPMEAFARRLVVLAALEAGPAAPAPRRETGVRRRNRALRIGTGRGLGRAEPVRDPCGGGAPAGLVAKGRPLAPVVSGAAVRARLAALQRLLADPEAATLRLRRRLGRRPARAPVFWPLARLRWRGRQPDCLLASALAHLDGLALAGLLALQRPAPS